MRPDQLGDFRFPSDAYLAAVAERGVYSWVSLAGTTDIPWFMQLYLPTDMPDGGDEVWAASPLARAHAIETEWHDKYPKK